MSNILRRHSLYLLTLLIVLAVMSFLDRNFWLNGLFFICAALGVFISNAEGWYEKLYYTLITASIFDYTVYLQLPNRKIYFYQIVLVIVAIPALYKLVKDRILIKRFDKKIFTFYIVWFVYSCISILWSKNRYLNIVYIERYIIMFLFITVLIAFNKDIEKLKTSFKVLGFMFLATLLIGASETLLGKQLPVLHHYTAKLATFTASEILIMESKPIVFFFNPNNFATYITICIPFLLYAFFYKTGKRNKIAYFLWLGLAFTVLTLTESRANILGMVLMLIIYTMLLVIKYKSKAVIYPLIAIVAFGAIYKNADLLNRNLNDMNKMDRLYKNKIVLGKRGSENERMTIYYDVIQGVIKDKHYFGFGVGNTQQYLTDRNNTNGIYSPHGLFTEILGDFGLPFFIYFGLFYLYLLYKLFIMGKNNFNKLISYSLFTSMLGFTLGSFSPSSVTYMAPYWMLFGFAIALIQAYNESSIKK